MRTTLSSQDLLAGSDPELFELSCAEEERQRRMLSLVPSENVSSPLARALEGGVFADKNAEGYPGRRVVAGCQHADAVERLAIARLRDLFGCEHANVQSMSATIANVALLNAVLAPGDTILSMRLEDGGHLSHGADFHISGQTYNVAHYSVDPASECIDMNQVADLAAEHRPKIIACGASSYPRLIDFAGFGEIARSVGSLLWADISHIVGLVAAGVIPSPLPHADFVVSSTHKTWRGPRGAGIIMCRQEWAKRIDRAVFPGLQGAPKMDMIAARAALFKETKSELFRRYAHQMLANAQSLAKSLKNGGLRLVTGGTDTHLILVDVGDRGLTGLEAERCLASVGLVANRNSIPFDRLRASVGSGLRLGTPTITTRGLGENDSAEIGDLIVASLNAHDQPETLSRIAERVSRIADQCPLFHEKWLPEMEASSTAQLLTDGHDEHGRH